MMINNNNNNNNNDYKPEFQSFELILFELLVIKKLYKIFAFSKINILQISILLK